MSSLLQFFLAQTFLIVKYKRCRPQKRGDIVIRKKVLYAADIGHQRLQLYDLVNKSWGNILMCFCCSFNTRENDPLLLLLTNDFQRLHSANGNGKKKVENKLRNETGAQKIKKFEQILKLNFPSVSGKVYETPAGLDQFTRLSFS